MIELEERTLISLEARKLASELDSANRRIQTALSSATTTRAARDLAGRQLLIASAVAEHLALELLRA